MSSRPDPWYADGLRFSCHGCGACCRVEGFVWVDDQAIHRLARHLDLSPDDFGRQFVRRVDQRYSLIERANHECVFWDDGCTVYEARPTQCRTFPFWPEQLESAESWGEAAATCRGMNGGRLYPRQEVSALADGAAGTEDGPAAACGCARK